MQNPVVTAREKLGLSRSEAALKMGTNYQSLMRLELAHPTYLAEVWRPRFERIGVDFNGLKQEYVDYRAAQVAPAASLGG